MEKISAMQPPLVYDGKVIFYHGTPPENNKSIAKQGLVPNKKSNSFNDPSYVSRQAPGEIHLTSCPLYASIYGKFKKDGSLHKGEENLYRIEMPVAEAMKTIREKNKEASAFYGMDKAVYARAFVSSEKIPTKYITKVSLKDAYDYENSIMSKLIKDRAMEKTAFVVGFCSG